MRNLKLSRAERMAVEDLRHRLQEVLDKNLISVVLYGSKARGDAHPHSDIDVLVFVHTYTPTVHDQVYDVAWDILRASNFAFRLSVQTIPEEEWQKYERFHSAFYQNVREEGIPL